MSKNIFYIFIDPLNEVTLLTMPDDASLQFIMNFLFKILFKFFYKFASSVSLIFSGIYLFLTPFSLFLALCLFPTFLAEGDGVVHDPADQSHEQPQQNKEDPVLPHPRDQELLAPRSTH